MKLPREETIFDGKTLRTEGFSSAILGIIRRFVPLRLFGDGGGRLNFFT